MNPANSSRTIKHDKEIDALLNRLHSGCRFVDFEDSRNRKKGSAGAGHDVSNLLRNSSAPDETHAELGRALAHSYVGSLQLNLSSLRSSSNEECVRGAIGRGERIVESLCCGENSGNDGGSKANSEQAYASVAYAFFGHLASLFASNGDYDDTIKSFIQSQWQNWCIRCEEIALPSDGMPSELNGGGGVHVSHACLKNYGYICFLSNKINMTEDDGTINCGCSMVYQSLKHSSSRKYLIRTCVAHAASLAQSSNTGLTVGLVESLSPLFRSCVLSPRKTTIQTVVHAERQLILQEILRGCSTMLRCVVRVNDASHDALIEQIANMVHYLSTSLTSYLNQSICASFSEVTYGEHQHESTQCSDVFELGYDWLRGVCDLMSTLVSMENNNIVEDAVSRSVANIVTVILPQFTTSSMASLAFTFDMAPIYSSLISCISSLPQRQLLHMANATVAFRLGSLLLTLQDDAEVQLVIDLMIVILKCLNETGNSNRSNMLIGGMSTALGCVFRCRPACFGSAARLIKLGESLLQRDQKNQGEYLDGSDGRHLVDLLLGTSDDEGFGSLIEIVSASICDTKPPSTPLSCWQRRPLTLSDQCCGLLLGLSLLHASTASPQNLIKHNHAFEFIRSFLQCYPRMASRVVPSVIDVGRTCIALQSTSSQPLPSLAFLASPCIVSDPHGAHLAWSFLSSLVKEGVPTAVRSAVIRLLPQMCANNKRLFRRTRDVIGKSIVAQDPIIRISATAALSDMANLDLLRDVEQIVGWIQNRLTDDEPAVVYYALETLRYLVVNEELEFDLVIRVLEKRLNLDLSNMDDVLALDTLALEGLIALMGEGGLEEEDDDESNDEDEGGPEVSLQSVKAVTLLVELALSNQLTIKNNVGQDKEASFLSHARIQRKVYSSLSGYSSLVLGLDEEEIRSWDGTDSPLEDKKETTPEVDRFLHLKEIVLAGFNFSTELHTTVSSIGKVGEVKEIAAELLESATSIGSVLLQFEVDCHGSFLFRGGSSSARGSSEKSSKGKTDGRTRVSKSVLSSLPAASSIQEIFESDPRSASATAVFCSMGSIDSDPGSLSQTEDLLAQMSECFGDIANEPLVDPPFQAIQVCSLMHCMDLVWKSIQNAEGSIREELLDKVVAQTEEWSSTYGEEYAYVAMAAFALSVDDSSQCWPGVTNIHRTILEGQDNYLFESEDAKLLCLGIIAARLSRAADARVTGIIDSFERSLSENDRQTCFGAFFGLGIIVTNLMVGDINGTDPSDSWRRQQAHRILCMILTSFNACLAQESDEVLSLITSIKSGQAAGDLSESCSNMDSLIIQDGSAQKMKAAMIGLSHCFPVLSATSSHLLKCLISVVEKLPWGSGKGFVLPTAFKNAIDVGVLEQKDLSETIADTLSYVQDSSRGFGDALLSLASMCRLSPGKVQQELDTVARTCQKVLSGGGGDVGGDDKLMSILASCAAIGELPGFATFTTNIYPSVKKNFVTDTVKMLEGIALNDTEELKYKDATTIGLGALCAMSRSSQNIRNQTQKSSANKFESIQAKDGSVMQGILQEVEKAYALLCTAPPGHTSRVATVSKLCAFFSALEPIAMPGNFSRVIELTLNDSLDNELELKASSIQLLVSQLESRRRIGFDGRGFVDLSTRLTKMPSNELHSLVGPNAIPMMVKFLPDLIYQIPTSTGEEMVEKIWAICCANLEVTFSSQSMTEYLVGFKSIFISTNREETPGSKRTISPALLRTLQKFIVTKIFSGLCAEAVPSQKMTTVDVWATYLQCLELIPNAAVADVDSRNCEIDHSTAFGMAICASLSPKSTRKVESWIARQEMDYKSVNMQTMLQSTLAIATQARTDHEMKESVLSIFELMLVKGVDTMALYLVAAKVAFWWESRQVHQLQYADTPIQHVSSMSSFFATRNLSFDVRALAPEQLTKLFDSFVSDLPSKLAVLSKMWKISDDISNRASRIWNAHVQEKGKAVDHLLSCVREIVQFIDGGEIN